MCPTACLQPLPNYISCSKLTCADFGCFDGFDFSASETFWPKLWPFPFPISSIKNLAPPTKTKMEKFCPQKLFAEKYCRANIFQNSNCLALEQSFLGEYFNPFAYFLSLEISKLISRIFQVLIKHSVTYRLGSNKHVI